MSTVIAIRHVSFEDLGVFADPLSARGLDIRYLDAGLDDIASVDALSPALLVVLGGPVGAYEEAQYPFLADTLRLTRTRLTAGRPVLGLCLGAQIMARALDARVYPGTAGKEIGWGPVTLSEDGRRGPLAALAGVPVLHWHGDTFDLPDGAVRLASTPAYENQAFALGAHALGLQFHAEVDSAGFERWLIGHACEIAAAERSPAALRADTRRYAAAAASAGRALLTAWLDGALR